MADETIFDKVSDLTDLELAVLLCLVSREHCLISTSPGDANDLISELQLIATNTFGLHYFAAALLLPKHQNVATPRSISPYQTRTSSAGASESYFVANPASHHRPGGISPLTSISAPSSQIANCVLARNLDLAPQAVQIQALELLRTRRIFTRTSVQAAPKQFIFIPVLEATSGGAARVTKHLNDFFFIAHWHDPDDGYVNLEEKEDEDGSDTASTSSVLRRANFASAPSQEALITEGDISHLAKLSQQVEVDIEVIRYQMNIVSFLRMHRAVADGISPTATKHFGQLMRCLAPLHHTDFVTPALVGLAVRKVYLHRIRITSPEKERSMHWGSKLDAVQALLEGIGPEEVIEDVLEMVTAPL
ncbi:hypothetical protein NLU13_9403 [Sarocladium strictum]|uniref:magnesium chelatase n=1 Tax=Sarocladium strictum TaxID=5046 RepID=A0AA39L459_SARSR|nr:hypothetical protein NLU13_9403 [Sarocladium strictum]